MNKRLSTLTTLIVLLILCGSTMETHAKVVGYWSFNNSEHIGEDSSPNQNHGELKDRDRAKWVWPAREGGALQLDGGPGLEVPHDESLNFKDQLTLMCWVKFADHFDFGGRGRQQSLIWKSAPRRQVSYGLYVNRGQLELELPLYANNPGRLFSWLYVIDPKCRGQFINGIPDFPARCQRKFAFGLGDSRFGNLGFRASMPGAVDVHAVHPTFFVDFFPIDNFLLDEDDQDFLKRQEQDFVQTVSDFMIGTSNIYLPRIIRHFEPLDKIWFHFAVVADGHSIRLYVNGREKVSERQGSDRQPEPFLNSQEPLTIGTGLDGIIDEVMIFDHALTENEIKAAMDTLPFHIATPVVIPDPNLARSLRTALGLAPNKTIFREAMQQLRKLHLFSRGIKDITGLEHATNLEWLDLRVNQISDVSPLAGLTNLESLWLSQNQISDVSPLAGLTNLESLWLSQNQISDVSPLAGLTNLENLQLWENQISDVSPLTGLINLEDLELRVNQISDVSPLAGLTNLESLWLSQNQISDVSSLAGLTNLESLYLHGNPISDTSPLANLTNLSIDIGIFAPVVIPDPNLASALRDRLGLASSAPITGRALQRLRGLNAPSSGIADLTGLEHATNLESLDLQKNQISDVSPLAGLTNLEWLSLFENQISDVSALAGLTNLESLDLQKNQISDVSPLVGLTNLEKLYLWGNQISDVSALAGLTNLKTLWLGSNPISDTSPLANLPNLSKVDVHITEPLPVAIPEDERESAIPLPLEDSRTEEIDSIIDVDYFSIQVEAPGQLTLWTTGTVDTMGTLGNSAGIELAANDDENVDADEFNFRIAHDVEPGTYYLKVESYESDTGNYTVYAAFTPATPVTDKFQFLRTLSGHTDGVFSVSFSPDGQMLASGSSDNTIRLWDAQTGRHLRTLSGHTDGIFSVSFSPDGQMLASGSSDNTIRLWDAQTGRHLRTLSQTDGVFSVSFSPDGQMLASGEDETVRLWEVKTGRHLRTLRGHTRFVPEVSFSPDGSTLASGSLDETVRLWDAQTGRHLRTLRGQRWGVSSVSFSPDGQMLASGGGTWDKTVRLWDAQTGRHLRTLTDTDWAVIVSFSPDGQMLASGGGDGDTVRLWEVRTGRLLQTLTGPTDWISSMSFSPDGQMLASGGGDKTVFLWALEPSSTTLPHLQADVNQDGIVNILDLTLVASSVGKSGQNSADVNGDGVVNILDLTLVAGALENAAGAPALWSRNREVASTRDQIEQWLHQAREVNLTDSTFQRGILMLEQLLASLTPKETVLLPNYPNPFNPETWIPYRLAESADVNISIYAVDGTVVRQLVLGHQPIGIYQGKSRAAYWDGRNAVGEPVASGVYFYTLTAGEFTATRKMLIRK